MEGDHVGEAEAGDQDVAGPFGDVQAQGRAIVGVEESRRPRGARPSQNGSGLPDTAKVAVRTSLPSTT